MRHTRALCPPHGGSPQPPPPHPHSHGKDKPVIKKALVELAELPFKTFAAKRKHWALVDSYRNPGPTQLSPDTSDEAKVELCFTLSLELKQQQK